MADGTWIELEVADGTTMAAYVARPAAEKAPGILVFQEAFGVNSYIRSICDRLAAEGWNALAPEVYHRTAPPHFEAPYGDRSVMAPHFQALNQENLLVDIAASYSFLEHDPATNGVIDVIGFCMGGRVAFLAATAVRVHAAVSFYGGGIAPNLLPRVSSLSAPILMFWGGLDQHIPPAQHRAVADALRGAQRDFVDVEISYADHGFFCDQRASFNERAAAEAWPLTLAFLRR